MATGKVIIWDRGTYEMVDPDSAEEGSRKGKPHFILNGEKLNGEWVLVRGSREPKQWIFFKVRDRYASANGEIVRRSPRVCSPARSSRKWRARQQIREPGRKGVGETKHWFTPIERKLEEFGMKAAGRVPMPERAEPMLATSGDKPLDNNAWLFELKMDGIRALVMKNGSKLEMWTRNTRPLTDRFPTLAAAFRELPADTAILDGEIVVLDEKGHSHFSLIQPRIHLSCANDIEAAADENIPAYFYAFDLIYLNGFDMAKFPLVERKAVLRAMLPDNGGWIRYTDHVEDSRRSFLQDCGMHTDSKEFWRSRKRARISSTSAQTAWIKIKIGSKPIIS